MAFEPANPAAKSERQYAFHEFVVNANITTIMDFLLSSRPADAMEAGNQIQVSFRVNLLRECQDEVEHRRRIKPTIRFIVGEHTTRDEPPLGRSALGLRRTCRTRGSPQVHVMVRSPSSLSEDNETPPSRRYDVSPMPEPRLTPQDGSRTSYAIGRPPRLGSMARSNAR